MDSLRWDIFNEADAQYLQGFTDYQRAYSRAGCTIPSVFALFMNIPWCETKKVKLIPWMKSWVWVPRELRKLGYETSLLTPNEMFKLYQDFFSKGFDNYEFYHSAYSARRMVNRAIELFKGDKPQFVFMLFMETHYPYVHPIKVKKNCRYPIEHQLDSVAVVDKQFIRLVEALKGTNTEIIVFADHGDLDYKREGDFGHGHGTFHRKLFEIPLGRKTI